MKPDSVVLISGCSTGIGRSLVREFAARGCRVFATARNIETIQDLQTRGIEIAALDVTDDASISNCVETVIERAGKIDILVNNAGLLLIGPLVELSADELRRQFETNVIGLAALTRAVTPHMISRKAGIIVNISSITSVAATPFAGAYCSTKAAVTSLSDTLRLELAPFGIRVVTVQPGAIRSNLSTNADKNLARFRKTPYGPIYDHIVARANASQQKPLSAEVFAQKLIDNLEKKKLPALIRIGPESIRLPFVSKLPRSVRDALLSKRFGLDKIKSEN